MIEQDPHVRAGQPVEPSAHHLFSIFWPDRVQLPQPHRAPHHDSLGECKADVRDSFRVKQHLGNVASLGFQEALDECGLCLEQLSLEMELFLKIARDTSAGTWRGESLGWQLVRLLQRI